MGYFLWLNDRIDTTNAAQVIAIINASNTDTATTGPHEVGHADVAARCDESSLPSRTGVSFICG